MPCSNAMHIIMCFDFEYNELSGVALCVYVCVFYRTCMRLHIIPWHGVYLQVVSQFTFKNHTS